MLLGCEREKDEAEGRRGGASTLSLSLLLICEVSFGNSDMSPQFEVCC